MLIEMKERILNTILGKNRPYWWHGDGEMIGLTDRIRLRPLSVGEKGTIMFLSSEESAIRLVCPNVDRVWMPMGGQPVIGSLERPLGQTQVTRVEEKPMNMAGVRSERVVQC